MSWKTTFKANVHWLLDRYHPLGHCLLLWDHESLVESLHIRCLYWLDKLEALSCRSISRMHRKRIWQIERSSSRFLEFGQLLFLGQSSIFSLAHLLLVITVACQFILDVLDYSIPSGWRLSANLIIFCRFDIEEEIPSRQSDKRFLDLTVNRALPSSTKSLSPSRNLYCSLFDLYLKEMSLLCVFLFQFVN